MVTLLAKIFIKDSEDKIKQREAYGMLCGVIGILFNVLLFIGKFLAGTLSNSIAITADAFNNLFTMFSQVATEPWMANWQRLRTVIHISQNTNITS